MKNKFLLLTILPLAFIFQISSCYRCPKKDKTQIIWRFKDSTNSFIPDLNGSITFQSDSNKTMVFDKVSTTHDFKDFYPCEENCCDPISHEFKTLYYWSNAENLSFGVHLFTSDSADKLTISESILEFPSSKSNYVANLIYIEEEVLTNIFKNNNCKFLDTLKVDSNIFYNVYSFNTFSAEGKKFAETLYYNKKQGIIGFILNDKSVWLKK